MDEEELEMWYDEKVEELEKQYTTKINILRDPFPEEDILKKKNKLLRKYNTSSEAVVLKIKEEFEKDSDKLREDYQKKYDKIYDSQQRKRDNEKKKKIRQKKYAPITRPTKAALYATGHAFIWIFKSFALLWKRHKEKSAKNAVILHYKLKKNYDFKIHPPLKPVEYPVKNMFRRTIGHPLNKWWLKTKEKNHQRMVETKKTILKIIDYIIDKAKKVMDFVSGKMKKIQEKQEKYQKKFDEFKEKHIQPILDKLPKLKKKEDEE